MTTTTLRTPRIATILAATALLSSAAHAAGVQLVTNGGFETGDFTGYTVVEGSASSIYGVDSLGPRHGDYSAFFGSFDTPDSISQVLATTAGTTYTVSFYLDSSGTSGARASFIGTFGGTTFISLTDADADFTFKPFVYEIEATSSTTVLSFSLFNDNYYYTLDDISVEAQDTPLPAVPEPSSYALMALGLASIGWTAWRRRSGSTR